jgi:uncharacterized membrane protein AbrB (regulator of aidB expression)
VLLANLFSDCRHAAAWPSHWFAVAGIDPLTAYLATSPGGMDSVAIIGAASNVDLSFVMALQTLRLVIVLIVGPPLARIHRPAADVTGQNMRGCRAVPATAKKRHAADSG